MLARVLLSALAIISSTIATTFEDIELEHSDYLVALRTIGTVRGFLDNNAFVAGVQLSEAFRTNFLTMGPATDDRLRELLHSIMFSSGGLQFRAHVGFEDGKYMQYTNGLYFGTNDFFTFLPNENASCPAANIPTLCSTTFATTSNGVPVAPISFQGGFDPRTQSWYADAKASLQPVWSRAFPLPIINLLGQTLSYPIVVNNTFIGVVAIDFCLLGFELYLVAEVADSDLLVYLVDDADKLTSANIPQQSVKVVNGTAQQVVAVESDVELIASTYSLVLQSQLNDTMFTIITANHSIQVLLFSGMGFSIRVVCVRNITQDSIDSVMTGSTGAHSVLGLGIVGAVATLLSSVYNLARVCHVRKTTRIPGFGFGLLLFSVGSALCCAAIFVLIGENTHASCQVRSWLLSLGLTVIAAGFVVNAVHVRRLILSNMKAILASIRTELAIGAISPPSAMIIAMIVIGRFEPYSPKEMYFETGTSVMHSVTCETSTMRPTIAVFILVCAMLVAAGLVLFVTPTPSTEWLCRDRHRMMLASQHSLAIFILIFGVTILPITPDSLTITRAILLFWLSFSVQLFSVFLGSPMKEYNKPVKEEGALPVVMYPHESATVQESSPDIDSMESLVV